jgi:leukotriene-A4 hydrolase
MKHAVPIIFLAISLQISTCSGPSKPSQAYVFKDPHSFSRPDEIVVTHLDLDITVDFDKKQVYGCASYALDNKVGATSLYLDTRELSISRVTLDDEEKETKFVLGDSSEFLGRALKIDVAAGTERVHIYYATTDKADALQWLEPAQTEGRKKPFLFTQSQPILARTWIPCQDSPGIRMTYRAKIRCPSDLMAVMSAENPTQRNEQGIYEFKMTQAVPSYLLALAVGDIAFQPLGRRSGVYAEPPMLGKAAWEFADTEKMIDAAEKLYGPYRWGRYDIIVLPPSFPFGGMENPRLTFATPTIIAGDRSLVSLIAHELAHSWSGNLVTNSTWGDFWLNEGFTMYVERRITEALYGKKFADMEAVLGYQDLEDALSDLAKDSSSTRLASDLAGHNPDDVPYAIVYEKGYYFLRMMEDHIGRDPWDRFLKEYFNRFAFQSMTSPRFVEYLRSTLIKSDRALERKLDIDAWVFGTGLPDNCPVVRSDAFQKVELQINGWTTITRAKDLRTKGWTTPEWMHFIRHLPARMDEKHMAELDEAFHFTQSGNSEILNAWLILVIANHYEKGYPALENFLLHIGRRKYVKPIYTELAKTKDGTEMAKRIYAKARPGYHSITASTIDTILKWQN